MTTPEKSQSVKEVRSKFCDAIAAAPSPHIEQMTREVDRIAKYGPGSVQPGHPHYGQ